MQCEYRFLNNLRKSNRTSHPLTTHLSYMKHSSSSKSYGMSSSSTSRGKVLPPLKLLGMDWLSIRDNTSKNRSPFKKSCSKKTFPTIEELQDQVRDYESSFMRNEPTSRVDVPSIEIERLKMDDDLLLEIQNQITIDLNTSRDTQASPFVLPRKRNLTLGTNVEKLIAETTSDTIVELSDRLSPFQGDYQNAIKILSERSLDSKRRSNTDCDITRTLARMVEANAEYESTLPQSARSIAQTQRSLESRRYKDIIVDHETREEEKYIKAIRSREGGYKVSPTNFFVSPSGVVNSSVMYADVDDKGMLMNRDKDSKIVTFRKENNEELASPTTKTLFESGTNRTMHWDSQPLLGDNIDYELFINQEKAKRSKFPPTHDMEVFLEKFARKPGKKTYILPTITEDLVRKGGLKVSTPRIRPLKVKEPGSKKTPRRPSVTIVSAQDISNNRFQNSLRAYVKPGTGMDDVMSMMSLDSARLGGGISPIMSRTYGVIEEEEEEELNGKPNNNKCLAELLLERFKVKFPSIQTRSAEWQSGQLNGGSMKKSEVDSSYKKRKNYDAWYVDPSKRAERIRVATEPVSII